ncbi:MAG TPA: helix-turn-helix domain-containing protein [Thermoguttaceae bacterium]|nr:helix-turn-helix domain-containing protein [Thermoguttaceae bacterium]
MIAPNTVREILELLAKGVLSQREIARRLGVSRGTVNAIALGRRPDHSARSRQRTKGFTPPTGCPVRCPTCGAKVQMPCLACQVRAMKRRAAA